mgnify:CR=1 FL=1
MARGLHLQPALSTGLSMVFVDEFIKYAKEHPKATFNVTRIGCGLAGYKDSDIAPMFKDAPANCNLPSEWLEVLRIKS